MDRIEIIKRIEEYAHDVAFNSMQNLCWELLSELDKYKKWLAEREADCERVNALLFEKDNIIVQDKAILEAIRTICTLGADEENVSDFMLSFYEVREVYYLKTEQKRLEAEVEGLNQIIIERQNEVILAQMEKKEAEAEVERLTAELEAKRPLEEELKIAKWHTKIYKDRAEKKDAEIERLKEVEKNLRLSTQILIDKLAQVAYPK